MFFPSSEIKFVREANNHVIAGIAGTEQRNFGVHASIGRIGLPGKQAMNRYPLAAATEHLLRIEPMGEKFAHFISSAAKPRQYGGALRPYQ